MHTTTLFKTSPLAAVLITAAAIVALGGSARAQARPDLRVTAINTPGGLCRGKQNKVQATIQNSSQLAPVNTQVHVWLRVKSPQQGVDAIYQSTTSAIGPNGSQPAWFKDIDLPKTGNYELMVTADPGNNIPEALESNNVLTINRSVQKDCNQAPTPSQTYPLTIRVYQHGTWSGGQGQWIAGASVILRKKYDTSFAPLNGTTNAQGQVTFNVPGSTLYEFSTTKAGCQLVSASPAQPGSTGVYQMATYAATRYLALNCQ
jgi:hypothetical protein